MKLANDSILNASHLTFSTKLMILALSTVLIAAVGVPAAFAQCTLSSPDTWTDGNGNWNIGGNWSGGVPTSSTNACITDGTSTVDLGPSSTGNVLSLQLASGNTLNLNLNTNLNVFGTQILNNGQIDVDGGSGTNTQLILQNNVTLSGTGTVTLSTGSGGGSSYIDQGVGGLTLTNQSTINGAGIIGNNGLSLNNSGTVNANVSGQGLFLDNMSSGTTNTGLLEATNGGVLNLQGITVNNAGGNITANSGSTVQLYASTVIQGGTLNNNGGGAFLGTPQNNTAFLDGSTGAGAVTINGTYTSQLNTNTFLLGTINNKNNLLVQGGNGTNTQLIMDSASVMLQGGGTVTLSTTAANGGNAFIDQQFGGITLTNVNNTIQGDGIIGQNGLAIVNQAGGTINANSTGVTEITTLTFQNTAVTNAGLMEATNNGVLNFNGVVVNNAGGRINAVGSGASVQLYGSTTIQGGTLNNNGGAFFGTPQNNTAFLDGSTGAGAVTINGTYTGQLNTNTLLLGTINNKNNLIIQGGNGTNTQLIMDSASVMLQGGGTVTLSTTAANGGNAFIDQQFGGITVTNINNTIQGDGILGNNGLAIVNQATINANSNGGAEINSLTFQGTAVTNTGLIEATNSGVLNFNGVVVNNAGGNITGNGGSASVQFYGNAQIQGGNLNNNSAAFFGTPQNNSAFLDGSTGSGAITIHGTYTSALNTDTFILGTINNNNNLLLIGGNGTNSFVLTDSSNVMLQGGGTVTLSTLIGGGNAFIEQAAGGETLTNVNNTIQGDGILGNNGLTIINQATINANSNGGVEINSLTIQGASVTNTGLMEATNSGVLNINGVVVNNAGGNITANGGSASVQLYGNADIQGGTLNNNSGVFFGTPVSNSAILDGSTSAGMVTLNGTYTSDLNSQTLLLGTINNHGNILVNGGSGNNTALFVDSGTLTLQGGGTVTLSTAGGGGNAFLEQAAGGLTLDNVDNTIQGNGIVGNNGLSLTNGTAGTVLANVFGGTLFINGGGTVTNNGTFQADAGSLLHVQNVAFTNFSGSTLTGGTYNVFGNLTAPGTLQIDPLGTSGGEIVNNAATIYLNGPNSNFVDASSLDALSNFSNNTASGSFTITNGRNFTSPSAISFANAGAVTVGSGSTFTTGGSRIYNQSGGSTQLIGTLTSGGGQANFNGGVLYGNGGTINGNVTMAGTIAPAATINSSNVPLSAGQLNINGNYTQTAAGIFNLGLAGLTQGTQFGYLNISGSALINGTLDVNLIGSFFPAVGDTFTFLTTGGSVTGTFATTNGLNIGNGEILNVIYGSNFIELSTAFSSTTDRWLGGTGVWSNGSQWSIGVPQPAFDTIIYSGGNDLVTMDVGSSTVKSLTVGGASNGFTSELTDGGTAQVLNITNGLTIGQQGILDFTGNASSITTATVSNNGSITIGQGVTLNLTNQPLGVTSVGAGSSWTIGGNFAVGGVANTGFSNLSSNAGVIVFENGASQSINTSLTNTNSIDLENGTALTITGNADNFGFLGAGLSGGTGNNDLIINGTLTNQPTSALTLFGTTDSATIGGDLINSASANVTLEHGSMLQIDGNLSNSGLVDTAFSGGGHGNTISVTGTLTNILTGTVLLLGPGDMISVGNGMTNNGQVDLEFGSAMNVTGNLTNTGGFVTGTMGGSGGNTVIISGALNNSGTFEQFGVGDTATFGSLTNNAGGFVDVENGSTLNVTGNVINNSGGPNGIYTSFNGTGGNAIHITGTLTNNGMIGLESTGDVFTVGGSVTNNSGAVFAQTGGSSATFTSTLVNNGTVDLENASSLNVGGATTNNGRLSTSGFGGTGSNTVTLTGLLTNNSTGTVSINGPNDTLHALGGIANAGAISVTNHSTIDPPFFNNIGTLNIDGTSTFVVGTGTATGPGYVQLANGTLGEMISSSAFGQIDVAGNASLNGTLDILLQGGFNPAIGSTYDIILFSPGGLTGVFATIQNQIFNGGTEIWQITYDNTIGDVVLTAAQNTNTTPEPGTFLLLGSGLLGIAYGVRRRWLK